MTHAQQNSAATIRHALPLFCSLVGTVLLANWLVQNYGVIPVGFGLAAPAGVLAAGLAFTLRDLLHERGGLPWVLTAIALGAVVSYATGTGRIAVAGGIAFLCSELLDLAVYTPFRERRWLLAVAASGLAGLLLDSWLFLRIAFGSEHFFAGQVVGKSWVLAATVVLLLPFRRPVTA